MVKRARLLVAISSAGLLVLGLLWYVGALKAAWYESADFLCHRDTECARLQALEQEIFLFKLETGVLPRDTSELLSSDVPQWNGPYAKPEHLLDSRGEPILYLRSNDSNVLFKLVARRSDSDDIVREARPWP
jgi:hypothetical protein